MRVFIFIDVCLLLLLLHTTKKEKEGRKRKKDEEREVPDLRESIEEIPTVNFPLVSSKSLQSTDLRREEKATPFGEVTHK